MILAIRDKHDYVACDMNQATAKFKEVLTNIAPRYPEINFQLICNFSEEVCLLYIQYDYRGSARKFIIQKVARDWDNITQNEMGLKVKDGDSHCMLMTILQSYINPEKPSQCHQC